MKKLIISLLLLSSTLSFSLENDDYITHSVNMNDKSITKIRSKKDGILQGIIESRKGFVTIEDLSKEMSRPVSYDKGTKYINNETSVVSIVHTKDNKRSILITTYLEGQEESIKANDWGLRNGIGSK